MRASPPGVPRADAVLARAGRENFPVAARLFPRPVRRDLMAVYGFARLADELGDEAPGDRGVLLDWLSAELGRAFEGEAGHPILVRLEGTIRRHGLPRDPFDRLVQANRQDQRVHRYRTFQDLLAYCALSANPVGELVLRILGAATPERLALSDAACTGLQLVELWQDLGEDAARGRVYVPMEDLERFGYPEANLMAGIVEERFEELMRFQAQRTRWFLEYGGILALTLRGRAGLGVRLFTAGGLAALADLERRRFDTFARSARPTPVRRVRSAALELSRQARRSSSSPLRACEAITRQHARNFWFGIRLLPAAKRQALAAVYAMARRIDDIGDEGLPHAVARAELDRLQSEVAHPDPASTDPVVAALATAAAMFPVPMPAFTDLIEGVRMDLGGTRYERPDDVERYARLVAGSIGRLSVAVFGTPNGSPPDPEMWRRADDLGVAMQLTNILRDLREDRARGRMYLPAEDLVRFGCTAEDLVSGGPAMDALIRFEAARAVRWFERGLPLLQLLDRRSAACVGAMAGIYLRVLERIAADPQRVLRGRVSLTWWEKLAVAGRALRRTDPPRPLVSPITDVEQTVS